MTSQSTSISEPPDGETSSLFGRPGAVAVWGAYFLLVALVLRSAVRDGLYGDGLGYMGQAALEYMRHPLQPYVDPAVFRDSGHPLILCYVVGWCWKIFGVSVVWTHLAVWVCGALLLYQTHAVIAELAIANLGRKRSHIAGISGALLLLAHPTVLSMTAQFAYAVPEAAFILAVMRAAWMDRPRQLAAWSFLLVFSRITGVVTLGGILAALVLCDTMLRKMDWKSSFQKLWGPAISLALFLLYLTFKFVILGRDLTTYPTNTRIAVSPAEFVQNFWGLQDAIFASVPWGMAPLLVLGVFAHVVLLIRQILFKKPFAGPDAVRLAVIALAGILATLLFYALHSHNRNPRYYVFVYPFIVILFVHAAVWLNRFFRAFWLMLSLLWILLQSLRSSAEHWDFYEKYWGGLWRPFAIPSEPVDLYSRNPSANFLSNAAEMTVEVRGHIAAMEAMADELHNSGRACHVIGSFGSAFAFMNAYAGYADPAYEGTRLAVDGDEKRLPETIRSIKESGRSPVLVVCAWDYKYWEFKPSAEDVPAGVRVFQVKSRGKVVGEIYFY